MLVRTFPDYGPADGNHRWIRSPDLKGDFVVGLMPVPGGCNIDDSRTCSGGLEIEIDYLVPWLCELDESLGSSDKFQRPVDFHADLGFLHSVLKGKHVNRH